MGNMIIAGKECESCAYSNIDDSNKSKIIIKCKARNKVYLWGQCIPCNDKKQNRRRV